MKLPHRFGRYVLTEKVAQGGLAEIYRAEYSAESGFVKEVAVKRLLPLWSDNKQFITMMIDEAKALVRLTHPNIVQVFELGRDQEAFYISMEYIHGVDLRQLFNKLLADRIELPRKLLLFIFMEALRALDFAHTKELKIIHRDISPQNMMVSFDGAVKVADFGIAKGLHRNWETTVTQVKGKFSYMSPEQATGQEIDFRSDLYSLGIVLYEFLSSRRLFEGPSDLAVLELVRHGKLPEDALQGIPGELRAIVFKALQKNAIDRYQTAADFMTDLHRFAVAHQEVASGFELADFLKKLFPEKSVKRPMTAKAVHQTKIMPATEVSAYGNIAATFWFKIGGAAAGLALLFGLFWWWPRGPEAGAPSPTKAPVSAPISEHGSVRVETEPSGVLARLTLGNDNLNFTTPFTLEKIDITNDVKGKLRLEKEDYAMVTETFELSDATPVFVKKYSLQKIALATVSIQAEPWGYVYIPGVVEKRETPVSGLTLKPGDYTIRVLYEPSNQWLETTTVLAAGGQYRCLAVFGDQPRLSCRQ